MRAWGTAFTLLLHELNKGIAELVALHALGTLDGPTYRAVTRTADQIEHEIWMLQIGAAAVRRFLAVLGPGQTPAAALMHAARMDPETFDVFALSLVDDPARARRLLGDAFDRFDPDHGLHPPGL